MIARMLETNIAVKLRINVQTKFYDDDQGNTFNVIAELPGTDPVLADEVVMIGAHLDSWHTGVGATDNADGTTTVMEAMRILKAVGARPRRTIRVALWAGEEQGLLGSKAWVQEHLAGDGNKAARDKFDVYFNIDNGTGMIYGWYLQNNQEVRAIFDGWLEPFRTSAPGATTSSRSDRPIISASSTLACPASTRSRITSTTTSARTTPTWTRTSGWTRKTSSRRPSSWRRSRTTRRTSIGRSRTPRRAEGTQRTQRTQ